MAIPDVQLLMLPLLRSLGDGSEPGTRDTLDALPEQRGLAEADATQPISSRKARLFANRVAWVQVHLKCAGLICSSHRRFYRSHGRFYSITERSDHLCCALRQESKVMQ
jgi:restriction endonuclease Mrr